MARSPIVKVIVTGDVNQLKSALGQAERSTKSFSDKMAAAAKNLAKGAGLLLVGAIGTGIKSLIENEKLMAQTAAVIKSTGGAAGVSAGQVQNMAFSLSDMSGVAHETVQNIENVLLTFKQIKGDQFKEATLAVLDMSVALGQDAQSAAIQLGKALNDPIGQLGALGRVGIQFNDSQTKAIKSLAAMGDIAGAQKIILEELRSEFGGSAEAAGQTLGGAINILRNDLEKMTREMASELIPFLREGLIPLIGEAADAFLTMYRRIEPIIGLLGKLTDQTEDASEKTGWYAKWMEVVWGTLGQMAYPLTHGAELWEQLTGSTRQTIAASEDVQARWENTLPVAKKLAEWIDINAERAANLATRIGSLADTFTGKVRESLRNVTAGFAELPDKIDVSLTELIARMTDKLADVSQWHTNLQILAAQGFEDLANTFAQEGIAYAPLLAEAIVNPALRRELALLMGALGAQSSMDFFNGVTKFGQSELDSTNRRLSPPSGIELRAGGGSVVAGKPYIVGERGPELFVPNQSGGIMANGVSGGNVNIGTINITGVLDPNDPTSTRNLTRELERSLREYSFETGQ